MSHNTGNELESSDILDFEDNTVNLDILMNADQEYWTDRLGNKRPTIDYALRMAGFTPAGFDFATGGILGNGDRNKCVFNQADQTWYSWSGNLPYNVIAGSEPGEGWKVVNRDYFLKTVTYYGADDLGKRDSTAVFKNHPGVFVPSGTYLINEDLTEVYPSAKDVFIIGNGTVKLDKNGPSLTNTPIRINKTTGGEIYTTGASDITAGENEFYRLPTLCSSKFNKRTFLTYVVMTGTRDDIGQNPTQTSRIELRYTNNNLTFSAPVTISTEGEQQASEPSMIWDDRRSRLWIFYTTANGKVGVGHGTTGFDKNKTMQTWMTFSDTYGDTWSTPVNITSKVKPFDSTSAWTPPSEICIAGDGSLLVPYSWIKDGGKFYHGYLLVNEDRNGNIIFNRQLIISGGQSGSNGGGEHQIVQLGDGSFLALVRDYYTENGNTKGKQCIYRSFNGLTWKYQTSINTTNCKAGLTLQAAQAFGDSRDVLLITAPTGNDDSDLYRNNLKLWASTNSGETWQEFPTPLFGEPTISTGYSTITTLANGAVLIAAEGSLYKTIGVRHKALGSFTGESTFAGSWGSLCTVQTAAEGQLCSIFDIPNLSLFWNKDLQTLNFNDGGTSKKLTSVKVGVDKTTPTTSLDSDTGGIFYLTASMTINQITGSGDKVIIVSTQAAQPITLVENSGVPITERVRINKTLAGKMIVLWRTKYGWYSDSGSNAG